MIDILIDFYANKFGDTPQEWKVALEELTGEFLLREDIIKRADDLAKQFVLTYLPKELEEYL